MQPGWVSDSMQRLGSYGLCCLSLSLSPFTACNSDQISEESRRLICEDLHGGREAVCESVYIAVIVFAIALCLILVHE